MYFILDLLCGIVVDRKTNPIMSQLLLVKLNKNMAMTRVHKILANSQLLNIQQQEVSLKLTIIFICFLWIIEGIKWLASLDNFI